MNYYNPYFYTTPTMINSTGGSLFSRLFGGLTFGKVLNGTQRALTFANQAIPFVKQVKPVIGNAKTIFKVMNEFKKSERPIRKNNMNKQYNNYYSKNNNVINNIQPENNNNGPTFFM